MGKTVKQVIDEIIGLEGGYTNNPADPGGATRWGITEKTARQYGYTGQMRDLPRDTAFNILSAAYYTKPNFDAVESILGGVGAKLADCGVNMGQSVASKFLQRSLNALNNGAKLYPDVAVDGLIGKGTLAAISSLVSARGRPDATEVLLKLINGLQAAEYVRQVESTPSKEAFLFGWIKNRID